MNKIWLLLFMPIFLLSCQRNQLLTNNESHHWNRVQKAVLAFNQGEIICSDGLCPSHVAGVYLLSKDMINVGVCSGTLIGSDKILTNAHCVPKDIRKKDDSCFDRLLFYFPQTKEYGQEKLACKKVLEISFTDSSLSSKQPDWAILQLEKSIQRTPVVLNFNGIAIDSDVISYKINYESNENRIKGIIKKTSCRANSNHLFSQNYSGPHSALFNVSQCSEDLAAGHSGSSYLNKNNEMIALHSWGSYVLNSNDPVSIELRDTYPNLKQDYGGGTNVACIYPLNQKPPEDCYFNPISYSQFSLFYTQLFKSSVYNPESFDQREEINQLNKAQSEFIFIKTHEIQESRWLLKWQNEPDTVHAKNFIKQWLNFTFPQLPFCRHNIKQDFHMILYSISALETSNLNPDSLTEIYPTILNENKINISFDVESNTYILAIDERFIPKKIIDFLALEIPLIFLIPICSP